MKLTRRQQLIVLLTESPKTIKELASTFRCSIKDVRFDLDHVKKSVKDKLVVVPSQCVDCSFQTKKDKFVALSRCPKCRSQRTTDPSIYIKE